MKEKFQDQQWKYDYLSKWIDCEFEETKVIKRKNFPGRLYKYEQYCDYKVSTLEAQKFYLCQSKKFDDPYDNKGVFFPEDTINELIQRYKNEFNVPQEMEQEIRNHLIKIPEIMFEKMYITSFSEDKYNFPLWYYYAGKHSGYCIEYNFKQLKDDNLFFQRLEPVTYSNDRIDISPLIRRALKPSQIEEKEEIDPIIMPLHILGSTIKHCSWAFENEWRYIEQNFNNLQVESKYIEMPIKPTAIYLGKDFEKNNLEKMKEIAKELQCKLYHMKQGNIYSNQFMLDEEEILL